MLIDASIAYIDGQRELSKQLAAGVFTIFRPW
jgi:hypothetical protein